MKKFYTIVTLLFLMSFSQFSHAMVHIISVSNNIFSPAFINVAVGDTIQWNWLSGSHTTTSTSVPAGAQSWNSPITSSVTTFQYVVAVAGTYDYWCIPHAPGMAGSFVASSTTGIQTVKNNKTVNVYPNPFQKHLVLDVKNYKASAPLKIEMYNVLGKQVFAKEYTWQGDAKINIDLEFLNPGMYFIYVITDEKKMFKIFKEENTSYLRDSELNLIKDLSGEKS